MTLELERQNISAEDLQVADCSELLAERLGADVRYLGRGAHKVAYGVYEEEGAKHPRNVIRVYDTASPSLIESMRQSGTTEASYSDFDNSYSQNRLVARIEDVTNLPADISEYCFNLATVYDALKRSGKNDKAENLYKLSRRNHLTHGSRKEMRDTGIVTREDGLYVV